jgi:hypothetical protein
MESREIDVLLGYGVYLVPGLGMNGLWVVLRGAWWTLLGLLVEVLGVCLWMVAVVWCKKKWENGGCYRGGR